MIDIHTADTGRGAAWLLEGFDYFRRNAGAWIGIIIILLVINIVSATIPLAGMLVMQLLTPVFIGGLILGSRVIGNGGNLQINHLFAGFKQDFGSLVVLGLIYTLGSIFIMMSMVLVMFLTIGLDFITSIMNESPDLILEQVNNMEFAGRVLLVLLIGLFFYVPLLMAFWFAPALIVLDGQKPMESIKLSFMGCLKNIVPFLLYGVVGLFLIIIATIPLLLGWFIVVPMMIASIYIAYLDIYGDSRPVTIIRE